MDIDLIPYSVETDKNPVGDTETGFQQLWWYEFWAERSKRSIYLLRLSTGGNTNQAFILSKNAGSPLSGPIWECSVMNTYGASFNLINQLGPEVIASEFLSQFGGNLLLSSTPALSESLAEINGNRTWMVNVTEGENSWLARIDGKKRRSILQKEKKAIAFGYVAERTQSISDIKGFLSIYRKSQDRWGASSSSKYLEGDLRELCELEDNKTQLWVVKKDERVISGALCIAGDLSLCYWLGAADDKHFEMRPNNLLFPSIFRAAHEMGYAYVDLGPSGGHAGVDHFKSSLGASPLPFIRIEKLNKRTKSLLRLRKVLT